MDSDLSSNKRKLKTKAQAKKQLRKEEREKLDRYWKLVEEANSVSDPIKPLVSFQRFQKNGLSVELRCSRKTTLTDDELKWIFDLTKENMETLYEENWGWNDKEKTKELFDDRMWFLLATADQSLVAFTAFRFDLDFGEPVVYCYEIQLNDQVRGKGLGTFMMQILQLLAIKNGMHKVMATILHSNEQSTKFFMEKLKYQIDDTSLGDECYDIISKPVKTTS